MPHIYCIVTYRQIFILTLYLEPIYVMAQLSVQKIKENPYLGCVSIDNDIQVFSLHCWSQICFSCTTSATILSIEMRSGYACKKYHSLNDKQSKTTKNVHRTFNLFCILLNYSFINLSSIKNLIIYTATPITKPEVLD